MSSIKRKAIPEKQPSQKRKRITKPLSEKLAPFVEKEFGKSIRC